jgi:hypothetical protein
MASQNDLTTLNLTKTYLGITNTNSDAVLSQLITAESSNFLFLTRWSTFYPTTVTRYLDGTNTDTLMLTDRPIQSISLLQVGTITWNPSTGWPTRGYVFDSWGRVSLIGGIFFRARQNVTITYSYGFSQIPVTNEIQTVPSNLTIYPAYSPWYSNQSVAYNLSGTLLTLVTTAPTKAGQYQIVSPGQYLFHAADLGIQLIFNYTYLEVPDHISQCVNEMVGYKYGIRGSITVKSETIVGAQQVVRLTDYPDYICKTLKRYERKYGGTANASAFGGW